MRHLRTLSLVALATLAGCASHPARIATVTTPPPVPVVLVAAPLPPGATPGMRIPAPLADGSYPTPNRALSTAATVWHLRAGLNVAALSCPGAQGQAIVAGYNALLQREKAGLATAQRSYAAEYRVAGAGDDAARFDDAMTRLYNFFSQTPARAGFCTAAAAVLDRLATAPAGGMNAAATDDLAAIDRPFTDFYRAYDAWRQGTTLPTAPLPAQRVAAAALPRPAMTAAYPLRSAAPRLEIDPAVFGAPEVTQR